METRLRPGATADQATAALRSQIQAARNVTGGGNQPDNYLNWTEEAYRQLGNSLLPSQVDHLIETQRYWALRQMPRSSVGLQLIVAREIDSRIRIFGEAANELEAMQRRWQRHSGRIVVPDTNIFLHYPVTFDRIRWPAVLDIRGDVNLVIPMLVIDELDSAKRSGKQEVKTRARVTLRTLNSLLPTPDAVIPLGSPDEHHRGTTLEVLVDSQYHNRLVSADGEIVDRTLYIGEISGRRPLLVTEDNGMQLRAEAWGVETSILSGGNA